MKEDDSAGSGGLGGLLVKTKAAASKHLKSFSGRFGTPKSSKKLKLVARHVVVVTVFTLCTYATHAGDYQKTPLTMT